MKYMILIKEKLLMAVITFDLKKHLDDPVSYRNMQMEIYCVKISDNVAMLKTFWLKLRKSKKLRHFFKFH